jgi:uncharacterized membrane protein HdeD (DUF308 family)
MAMQLWLSDRDALRRSWWSFSLWGGALVIFGIAVLAWPALSGAVLVMLFGMLILVAGLVLIYASWRLREFAGALWLGALFPALSVAVFGAIVVLFPDAVGTVLLVVLAALAVIAGLSDIVSSVPLSKVFGGWWLRLLRGLLLIAAGIWLIAADVGGLVAVGTFAGLFALVLGGITIAFGVMALRV